ncbi:hypothetical protein SDC9_162691 [bioreactor metagenome]|uniref:Uncharacterized protein n=1 Tax=bioreactor metagenome TaxID=1076179 RepID=A0A645FN39_9ZZZZ
MIGYGNFGKPIFNRLFAEIYHGAVFFFVVIEGMHRMKMKIAIIHMFCCLFDLISYIIALFLFCFNRENTI